jgi:Fe-S-cluster containining protein
MTRLYQIQESIGFRVREITSRRREWPCRKGCDDCCRQLAGAPRVSSPEWRLIDAALKTLPSDVAGTARQRIRESASAVRPVVCPLLDADSRTCLVYEARPVACRAYGFYAERECVLGCFRIGAIADELPDVVWGNHVALEGELCALGEAVELAVHIGADDAEAKDRRC